MSVQIHNNNMINCELKSLLSNDYLISFLAWYASTPEWWNIVKQNVKETKNTLFALL